jgi:hypothetical protein
MKNFSDLTKQQEPLAYAITLEKWDNRTYSDLAEAMRETFGADGNIRGRRRGASRRKPLVFAARVVIGSR